LVLVAHKGHRLLGRRLHATDLSSELFLLRESGSSDRRSQEAALDLWELPTAQSTQLGSTEAIKCSMETGQGVTLMSRAAIQRELADGSLGVLHVEPPPPPRWIYAVHRSDHELTPTEDAFVALMRRHSSPPSRRPRSPVEVSS
jgi:DNA-binding transcriptional LysR family regulator